MNRPDPATPEQVLEREEQWSRGSALGEAVWVRLCHVAKWDPKDEKLQRMRAQLVQVIREAFFAMEGEGLEGLSEWLDFEHWAGESL